MLQSYLCAEFKGRLENLAVALEFYEKDKTSIFTQHAIQEEMLLLKLEREAEEKQPLLDAQGNEVHHLLDLSVSSLMEKYIIDGEGTRAGKLKTLLKIGDKRQWHVEVCALARAKRWSELEKLVSKKPPPIGYPPFIEACIQQGNNLEAAKYIARLPEYHEQMEWFCNIGQWSEAVDVAVKNQDSEALEVLKQRCRQPGVQMKIDKCMALLQNGPSKR